jgi:hypothetical protein
MGTTTSEVLAVQMLRTFQRTCHPTVACLLWTLQEILKQRGWEGDYPLFTTVNRILSGHFPPTDIVNFKEVRIPAVLNVLNGFLLC